MSKPTIYLAQFGTGTNINLLPLAAGQLAARLKEEKQFLKAGVHSKNNSEEMELVSSEYL